MLQMFTTQLSGKLKEIKNSNEEAIEDCARVLSQAFSSDGKLYIHGFAELSGVLAEALHGKEKLERIAPLFEEGKLTNWQSYDRILIFTPTSLDKEAFELVSYLIDSGATVVVVSSVVKSNNQLACISSLTDFVIDLRLQEPLVPTEDGTRIGFPSLLVGVYGYYVLSYTIKEFLEEL